MIHCALFVHTVIAYEHQLWTPPVAKMVHVLKAYDVGVVRGYLLDEGATSYLPLLARAVADVRALTISKYIIAQDSHSAVLF